MRLVSRFGLWGVVAASALPSAPVWADPPEMPSATEEDKGVLRGPRVSEGSRRATLISRDFDGKIKRLDIPPEEAALELIAIPAEYRKEIDRVLAERAAILDKIVAENLLKLVEASNASKSGDKDEARRIYLELVEQAAPLRERGKLSDEIKDILPTDLAQQYERIRKEYWEAVLQEDIAVSQGGMDNPRTGEAGSARAAQPKTLLAAALRKEVGLAIGAEIKRSYERQAAARADDLRKFVDALQLTPEQEGKIRTILTNDFQQIQRNTPPGKRTPMQSVALVRAIAAELDADQRVALGTYIRERQGK